MDNEEWTISDHIEAAERELNTDCDPNREVDPLAGCAHALIAIAKALA